jgi:hypothetical protein
MNVFGSCSAAKVQNNFSWAQIAMKTIRLLLTTMALLVMSLASTAAESDLYVSPSWVFDVKKPNFIGLKIQESHDAGGGRVSFLGDFGELIAITYQLTSSGGFDALSNEQHIDTDEQVKLRDKLYEGFLKDYFLNAFFKSVAPDATVQDIHFGGANAQRYVVGKVDLPNIYPAPGGTSKLGGKRIAMVFLKFEVLYMIEIETQSPLAQTITTWAKSNKVQENSLPAKDKYMNDLIAFKNSMHFIPRNISAQPIAPGDAPQASRP